MIGFMRRHPIMVLLTIAVLVLGTLNYNGYCYDQGRYLTKQELMDSAVRYELKYLDPKGGDVRYASVQDFYDRNENCCELEVRGDYKDPDYGIFFDRILFFFYQVRVRLHYRKQVEGEAPFYRSTYYLDSCAINLDRYASSHNSPERRRGPQAPAKPQEKRGIE